MFETLVIIAVGNVVGALALAAIRRRVPAWIRPRAAAVLAILRQEIHTHLFEQAFRTQLFISRYRNMSPTGCSGPVNIRSLRSSSWRLYIRSEVSTCDWGIFFTGFSFWRQIEHCFKSWLIVGVARCSSAFVMRFRSFTDHHP